MAENIVKRDSNGKFLPGTPSANPAGKPPGAKDSILTERRDAVLAVLNEEVTPEDWRDIVRAQVALAKKGNWRSVDWLSRYILGAPPEFTPGQAQAVLVSLLVNSGANPSQVPITLNNQYLNSDESEPE